MPQFDTTFFASQVFWTIVSFAVLFFLLHRWVLPHIVQTLKQRTLMIEKDFADAKKTRVEAEEIKANYTKQLNNAHQEVKQLLVDAEEDALKKHEQSMRELEKKLQRRKQVFINDEKNLREQSINEIRRQSSKLVITAAEQLIHHKYNEQDAEKELESAIKNLGKDLSEKT